MRTTLVALAVLLASAVAVLAVPSIVEQVSDGVYVVRDDNGSWDGHLSMSITHQNAPGYLAKKVLDASEVPAVVWDAARQVRLSVFFSVRDYSWHDLPKANGLDEPYEIRVNGSVNRYPTGGGAPVFQEGGAANLQWYDVVVPKEQFVRGINEIIICKADGGKEKCDDFLYLGIDSSTGRGNSEVDFGEGAGWTQEKLTIPGGKGEYMVRMTLITKELKFDAVWQPGRDPELTAPAGLIVYHGTRMGTTGTDGLKLEAGQFARLEWRDAGLDALSPIGVSVEGSGSLDFCWLDEDGKATKADRCTAPWKTTLAAGDKLRPTGLVLTAVDRPLLLSRLTFSGTLSHWPAVEAPDMRPDLATPAGQAVTRPCKCELRGDEVWLENRSMQCRFSVAGSRLRMVSLRNEWADADMVRQPDAIDLFLVEVGENRYSGSRDFTLDKIEPAGQGVLALLSHAGTGLTAALRFGIDDEGLRLGLELTNAGPKSVDFKLAFPHFSGLSVSERAAADFYYFPWAGGLFSDRPAILRRGYGDYEALYQVMDVFSPARGGGLYIRSDDAEGWHKVLALCKHVPGQGSYDGQRLALPTRDEYKWKNPLPEVEGVGFAFEYLRRTREPGGRFAPPPAVLAAHPGDWKTAMRAYAEWAHRVWTWRPYPSKLKSVHNMMARGWGQDILFKDGAYRTDIVQPMADCVELMSWWDWSPLGPLGASFDALDKTLTPAQIKMWQPYFVKDPVSGKMMWNNQPGDYKGYNERFGGLAAFHKAIQTYRQAGALVTLYTDPFRLDEFSCETGLKSGKAWCVMKGDGKLASGYEVTNPCHDLPEVREWVAATMKRVIQETDADGIRLDEYGHRGWACFNPAHQHTFAEPGVTQWNKAVADATRRIHAGMDDVKPGAVLTTEHPGYDYLMQYLDGCITYDLTNMAMALRPVEVNLQRFYFPECKVYELDHRGADRLDRRKFWNGVASFGRFLPVPMYTIYRENEDVYASRDCEALVPTLEKHVYANRFQYGDKALYHIYNGTGHTFEGPVLALPLAAGTHVVELLNCAALTTQPREGLQAVHVYLERKDVACVAVLPQFLQATWDNEALSVTVSGPTGGSKLVVCDRRGVALLTQDAQPGPTRIDLAAVPQDKPVVPVGVKLMNNGALVDVLPLPPRTVAASAGRESRRLTGPGAGGAGRLPPP
ncbi:MAG: hypothetical protein A3K19_09545 [Lentisphaerae bacterium RIFOXYB12_FULL_65_16]|nr:MAG: hypothetical protein A3K18_03565 [Lentisphaerae bacterium RIFOXYA12_64_32]OGV90495.1 MAG: hypothetical protein A3K19_09545 [Lentisphaerae bacterium RIFOXYB12_FULL_65_16]